MSRAFSTAQALALANGVEPDGVDPDDTIYKKNRTTRATLQFKRTSKNAQPGRGLETKVVRALKWNHIVVWHAVFCLFFRNELNLLNFSLPL